MELLKINPYIRVAMKSVLCSNSIIQKRIILDYEIIYIESGELKLFYYDRVFTCKEGDILLLCPNVQHSFFVGKKPLSQPHIHFDFFTEEDSKDVFVCFQDYKDLNEKTRKLIRQNYIISCATQPFIKVGNRPEFLRHFYKIVNNTDTNILLQKSEMLMLIDDILKNNENAIIAKSIKYNLAKTIKSYIDNNYYADISLDKIALIFNYNKYYLEKRFFDKYQKSIIKYRNEVCINKAKELLKEFSVSETSQRLHYGSLYSFSRAFKNQIGTSPTVYAKMLR